MAKQTGPNKKIRTGWTHLAEGESGTPFKGRDTTPPDRVHKHGGGTDRGYDERNRKKTSKRGRTEKVDETNTSCRWQHLLDKSEANDIPTNVVIDTGAGATTIGGSLDKRMVIMKGKLHISIMGLNDKIEVQGDTKRRLEWH